MRRAGFGRPRARVVAKIRRDTVTAYTENWETISKFVLHRDGNRCTRCHTGSSPDNKLRCHHIIPVSKGGRTVPYNLKTLCDRCHALQPGHSHLKHR